MTTRASAPFPPSWGYSPASPGGAFYDYSGERPVPAELGL
jgi:hypothetical protein